MDVVLTPKTIGDCFTIIKALVEADMERSVKPSVNLQARMVRALAGYLGLLAAPTKAAASRRTALAR